MTMRMLIQHAGVEVGACETQVGMNVVSFVSLKNHNL